MGLKRKGPGFKLTHQMMVVVVVEVMTTCLTQREEVGGTLHLEGEKEVTRRISQILLWMKKEDLLKERKQRENTYLRILKGSLQRTFLVLRLITMSLNSMTRRRTNQSLTIMMMMTWTRKRKK